DWQATFDPLIWQDVQVRLDKFSSSTSPPLELLIQNAGWIHRLHCEENVMSLVLKHQLTCPSLKSLNLLARAAANAATKNPTVALPEQTMIERHRDTLRELSLNFLPWTGAKIWEVIESCPKLERLYVEHGLIQWDTWSTRWRAWSKLRVLHLEAYFHEFQDDKGVESTLRSTLVGCERTRIQELRIGLCSGLTLSEKIEMLRHSPELTTLDWTIPSKPLAGPTALKLLSTHLRGDQCGSGSGKQEPFCPNLVSLTMNGSAYDEQDLIEFLETRTNVGLTALSLQGGKFSPRAWATILQGFSPQHLAGIRKLNLRVSKQVNGTMIQDMLCSLPGLDDFAATTLTDADLIQDPRPWVCLGLTRLELDFELSEVDIMSTLTDDTDLLSSLSLKSASSAESVTADKHSMKSAVTQRNERRQVIMRQLGRLTALQILSTDRNLPHRRRRTAERIFERSYPAALDFSFNSGLEHLHGMKNLQRVLQLKAYLFMGEAEIHWMLKHWPSLETFDGALHPDLETRNSLVALLRSAKIQSRT
ncbi:hypothetical protein BGZ83_002293, partial [Gryganskiella cystojenkinii]